MSIQLSRFTQIIHLLSVGQIETLEFGFPVHLFYVCTKCSYIMHIYQYEKYKMTTKADMRIVGGTGGTPPEPIAGK